MRHTASLVTGGWNHARRVGDRMPYDMVDMPARKG